MDLGTGDGRAVLARARREPASLVIGIDSDATPMRRASHRAAASAHRGGVPNAVFLVAAAATLPGPLRGRVNAVTVTLPWGSLLRGLALPEPVISSAVGGLLAAGGTLDVVMSIGPADRAMGLEQIDDRLATRLADAYRAFGLDCREARKVDRRDVEQLGSSWAKRLGIPERRDAWLFRFGTGATGAASDGQPPFPDQETVRP